MPSSKQVSRLKVMPWALLARTSFLVAMRWVALSASERARLASLVRQSRGRPSNLSTRERAELRRLVAKLDLAGAGRELMPILRGGKRSRRGR